MFGSLIDWPHFLNKPLLRYSFYHFWSNQEVLIRHTKLVNSQKLGFFLFLNFYTSYHWLSAKSLCSKNVKHPGTDFQTTESTLLYIVFVHFRVHLICKLNVKIVNILFLSITGPHNVQFWFENIFVLLKFSANFF